MPENFPALIFNTIKTSINIRVTIVTKPACVETKRSHPPAGGWLLFVD
jgi:hypothetical protein